MESTNAKNRSSKNGESRNISNSKAKPRSLGDAPATSSQHGHDPITVSREDRNQPNFGITRGTATVELPGKIVGQLVEETEKQLAYHKQQTNILENRLHELKQIPSFSTDIDATEDHL